MSEFWFVLGILSATFANIKGITWRAIIIALSGWLILMALVMAENMESGLLDSMRIAEIILLSGAITVASVVYIFAKQLTVSTNELSYIGYVGLLWFMVVEQGLINTLVAAGLAIGTTIVVYPLFAHQAAKNWQRFLYVVSHSLIIILIFWLYVGWENFSGEILSLQDSVFGIVSAFVMGFTFFYTFVHVIFVFWIFPGEGWSERVTTLFNASVTQFKDTQFHREFLITAFIIGVLLPWFLSSIVHSLLLSLAITSGVVELLGWWCQSRVDYRTLLTLNIGQKTKL